MEDDSLQGDGDGSSSDCDTEEEGGVNMVSEMLRNKNLALIRLIVSVSLL